MLSALGVPRFSAWSDGDDPLRSRLAVSGLERDAATAPAVRAILELVSSLEAAGIAATRDGGAVYPQPLAVLVGLPELVKRGAYSRTFEVRVLVISGDPLNSVGSVDRLYALADEVALELNTQNYRPSSFSSSANAEPLPALELKVTVSVTETEV